MKLRTFLYILAGVSASVGAGYLYLVFKMQKQRPATDYISRSALWVVRRTSDSVRGTLPFQRLLAPEGWQPGPADSIVRHLVPPHADCWISHHYYGQKIWHHLLIYTPAPPIARVLQQFSGAKGWKQRRYEYAGRSIYVLTKGTTRFAFARENGYLILGSSGQILEEAFSAADHPDQRAGVPPLEPHQGWLQWRKAKTLLYHSYPVLRPFLNALSGVGIYRVRSRGHQWEGYGKVQLEADETVIPLMKIPADLIPRQAALLIANPPRTIRQKAIPPWLDSLLGNTTPVVWVSPDADKPDNGLLYYLNYDSLAWEEAVAADTSWAAASRRALPHSFRQFIARGDTLYIGWIQRNLCISRDAAALRRLVQHYRIGDILANDPTFLHWQGLLPDSFHTMVYLNTALLAKGKRQPWGAIGSYTVREGTDSTGHIIAFHAWHSLPKRMTPQPVRQLAWELMLDTPVIAPPVRIYNYRTQQDEIGVVHGPFLTVVSSQGRLRWKRNLGGPLIDRPLAVDYYRNRKVQHLFLTSRKVFLIDRMGRDVAQYPIPLPEAARPGWRYVKHASVFSKRAYLVPTSTGVRGYYLTGRPIPRWSPLRLSAAPMAPIRYFYLRNIRRIFVADEAGGFYFISPRGKVTFHDKIPHPPATGWQLHLTNAIASSYAYCIDTTGALVKVSFRRKVRRTPLFTPKRPMFLVRAPLTSAPGPENIVVKGKDLIVFSSGWQRRWAIVLDTVAVSAPQVFSWRGRHLIGIWLADGSYRFITSNGTLKLQRYVMSAPPAGITDMQGRFLLVCPQGRAIRAYVLPPAMWQDK